jgi:hypothetical protein
MSEHELIALNYSFFMLFRDYLYKIIKFLRNIQKSNHGSRVYNSAD